MQNTNPSKIKEQPNPKDSSSASKLKEQASQLVQQAAKAEAGQASNVNSGTKQSKD
jgi:hypothetical protein